MSDEFVAADGTVRKSYYGDGVQPWDLMKEIGWAPHFAAGNALKYVRRYTNKNGDDDLKKGRWYYAELKKMVYDNPNDPWNVPAHFALNNLLFLLTDEEIAILEGK